MTSVGRGRIDDDNSFTFRTVVLVYHFKRAIIVCGTRRNLSLRLMIYICSLEYATHKLSGSTCVPSVVVVVS